MIPPSYYQVLGVSSAASTEALETAYRHKIENPGLSEDEFRLLSQAFHTLENPDSRRAYDGFLHGFEDDTKSSKVQAAEQGNLYQVDLLLTFEEAFSGTEKTIPTPVGPVKICIPGDTRDGDRRQINRGRDRFVVWIKVESHPVYYYRRDGRLGAHLDLSFCTAALGGKSALPDLGGVVKQIEIPGGARDGQELFLENLVVTFTLKTPTRLNRRQKQILKEFERTRHAA